MKITSFAFVVALACFFTGCVGTRFVYPDTGVNVENLKHTVRYLSTVLCHSLPGSAVNL